MDEYDIERFEALRRASAVIRTGRCMFCGDDLRNNNAKMLRCLHLICNYCSIIEMTSSGLMCKLCCEVSPKDPVNYPLPFREMCATPHCRNISKSFCVNCGISVCRDCVLTHANIHRNENFEIKALPRDSSSICLEHQDRSMMLFCYDCTVPCCDLCALKYHQGHDFETVTDAANEVKLILQQTQTEMKNHNHELIHCIAELKDDILNYDHNVVVAKNDVDRKLNTIFEKIKKHVYGELDEHFTNTRHKLLFNLGNSEILSIKNQYYIDLTDEILFHNPDHGSINVFRTALSKLNVYTDLEVIRNIGKINVQLESHQLLEKCITEFRNMFITEENDVMPEIQPPAFDNNQRELIEEPSDHNDPEESNMNPELESNMDNGLALVLVPKSNFILDENEKMKTICCHKTVGESDECLKCVNCERWCHTNCHIPSIILTSLSAEQIENWYCVMCISLQPFIDTLKNTQITDRTEIDFCQQRILERIFFELYRTQKIFTDFTENPKNHGFPHHCSFHAESVGLNVIKQRLNNGVYSSHYFIIRDLIRMYCDIKASYDVNSQFYSHAVKQILCLKGMVINFFPMVYTYQSFFDTYLKI